MLGCDADLSADPGLLTDDQATAKHIPEHSTGQCLSVARYVFKGKRNDGHE